MYYMHVTLRRPVGCKIISSFAWKYKKTFMTENLTDPLKFCFKKLCTTQLMNETVDGFGFLFFVDLTLSKWFIRAVNSEAIRCS